MSKILKFSKPILVGISLFKGSRNAYTVSPGEAVHEFRSENGEERARQTGQRRPRCLERYLSLRRARLQPPFPKTISPACAGTASTSRSPTKATSCGRASTPRRGASRRAQFREIGHLSNDFGRGIADVTTRQDIQLHWMTIENFPDALNRIYNKVGLYTDFACGDTPRNVCSCPLDGIIKNQIVDLGDSVQRLDGVPRGWKELSNLPRVRRASRPAHSIAISPRSTTSASLA